MTFLNILKNRLKIILTDKLFILTMVVIPILLSMITGYAQRKEKLGFIPIVLVDEDGSQSSQLLCTRLMGKEGIKAKKTVRDEAYSDIESENVEAMIIINKGFETGLANGNLNELITLIKSPSTYSAELLMEIVACETLRIYSADFTFNWLRNSFKNRGMDTSFLTRGEIALNIEEYWEPQPLMTIEYEEINASPKSNVTVTIPPFAAASMGLLILFIMLSLLFGSGWLCEEKINGTIQRAMIVNGAISKLFLGNVGALCIMGFTLTAIFSLVQWVFFDVIIFKELSSLLIIALYIFNAASISMLMASIFRTPHQLQASAPILALTTGIMGGCLWNLAGVPKSLLKISLLTPQGWALRALTTLYTAPNQWDMLLSTFVFLGTSALIFLAIAYIGLKGAVKAG